MRTTEAWLEEKLAEFKQNPEDALFDMLLNTNNVIEQYLRSPNKATLGVLESCAFHNNSYLDKIDSLNI
jgi:hypothetical protein